MINWKSARIACLILASHLAVCAAAPAQNPTSFSSSPTKQSAEAMSCRMGKQFLNTPTMDRKPPASFTCAPITTMTARPWRGVKRDQWEGGHRVPFLVRWLGKVKPGTTSAQLTSLAMNTRFAEQFQT